MKEEIKQICLSWEKLRVIYNIVLLVATVITFLVAPFYLRSTNSNVVEDVLIMKGFFVMLPFLGIGANFLYLLGPLAEVYLYFLDLNRRWLRVTIFVVGIILGSFAAFIVTLSMSHYAVLK